MTIESIIYEELRSVAAEAGNPVKGELTRATAVFDSGLDSLGFAILVAKLEERLGFDPFSAMAEPFYPQSLGEFIDVYADHAAKQ